MPSADRTDSAAPAPAPGTAPAPGRRARIAVIGFGGSVAMVLDRAVALMDDDPVDVVRVPAGPGSRADQATATAADPDAAEAIVAGADALVLQGVLTPEFADRVTPLLDPSRDGAPAVVLCGMPVAAELVPLSRGLEQAGLRHRAEAALRRLSPAAVRHALLLAAHGAGAVDDPGELPDDRPSGLWRHGEPLAAPDHRCGVVASAYQMAAGDDAPVAAVVEALRDRGVEPDVWIGDPGADDAPEHALWVNLTGFTLRGSHAEPRLDDGVALSAASGGQILTPVPLQRSTLEEWADPGTAQLTPSQVSMNIAIPEFEGALAPWVFCGRGDGEALEPVAETVGILADRVARTLRLRATPPAERRISITIFGHDADGTVGTASHLDVFRSLRNTLLALREAGHDVEVPDTAEEILDRVVGADGGGFRSASSTLALWPAHEYAAAIGDRAADIDTLWGRLPGAIDTTGRDMVIRGARFGNVVVGVQPSFGDLEDPLNVLMADHASPSHSFAAYYLWLERVFRHDLMLHFGTHGALEFMPGRGTGLLPSDWPVLLTGSVPHAYLYAMSNPAEGTIAKRRSFAQLVSYLTPMLDDAGLPGALDEVAALCRALPGPDAHDPEAAEDLAAAMDRADLTEFDVPASDDAAAWADLAADVAATVERIRRTPIPVGLHVLGEPIPDDGTLRILEQAATYPLGDDEPLHDHLGADSEEGEERLRRFCLSVVAGDASAARSPQALRWWRHLHDLHAELTSSAETDGLLRALAGGHVAPAPGGEPARNPAALPTGRNTHGVDPGATPTPSAMARGARVADELVARLTEEDGVPPRQVSMVIWGMDNVKTSGEGIAQAFRLIGAEALTGPRGRVDRYRVLSREELGRPRVDVTCTVSGVGRDLFSGPLELLDRAIREIALLDEPDDVNPLAAHAREQADELGMAPRDAATRIWSAAPGQYGTGVNSLVQQSQWDDRADLSDVYLHRMGHAWGADLSGVERRALLRSTMARVDAAFQNIDSSEISLAGVDHYFEFLGGTSAAVESLTGRRPRTMVNHAWSHHPMVEGLDEAMRVESRTRLLNPRWWRAQLEHGYQGAAMIRTRLENTFGFAATADAVDGRVFDRAAETFLLDDEVLAEFEAVNPAAAASMAERLMEAAERGLWDADDDMLDRLADVADRLDATLEGIE